MIRSCTPDAVALLEASDRRCAERLSRDLGMQLSYGEANSEWAVAWLSRLPIARTHNHRLPELAKTLLEVEVIWDGADISLFATHLVRGRTHGEGLRRANEIRAILKALAVTGGRLQLLVGDFNAIHPDDSIGDPPSGAVVEQTSRMPIQRLAEAG